MSLILIKSGLAEKVQIAGEQLTMANKELVQRINELATVNEISKAITFGTGHG